MSIFDGVYLYAAYPPPVDRTTAPWLPNVPPASVDPIIPLSRDSERLDALEKRLAAIEERLDKPLPLADEVKALREMLAEFIASLARKAE